MTYDEIKRKLNDAARLVDAGDLMRAGAVIRSMVGHGLTRSDLDHILGARRLAKLRRARA